MKTVSEIYAEKPDVAILHAIPKYSTRGSRDTDNLPLSKKLPYSVDRLKARNIPTFSMNFTGDTYLNKTFGDVGIIVRNADIKACFIEDGGITSYDDSESWKSSDPIKYVLDSKIQNELILTNGICCGIYLHLYDIRDWQHYDIYEANIKAAFPTFFIYDRGFIRCHWDEQKRKYQGSDSHTLKMSDILLS